MLQKEQAYYICIKEVRNIPNDCFYQQCSTMDRMALYQGFGSSFQTNLLVGTPEAGNCENEAFESSISDTGVRSLFY